MIGGLFAIGVLTLSWSMVRHGWFGAGAGAGDQLADGDDAVEHSGESFPLGNLQVVTDFGYSDDGDRLRYMVIRAYPMTSTSEERLADPRYQISVPLPLVRHADGKMRPPATDGRVYVFIGDELRTMRVRMNEHSDTEGLRQARSLEGMWDYLQRFRIAD